MSLFEQALRKKLRFPSKQGELTTEQLWELPLTSQNKTSLNSIAIEVNTELKAMGEESFVQSSRNVFFDLATLKLDILKHIIAVRQLENSAAVEQSQRTVEALRLEELLAQKKDALLSELSIEELQARIATLRK